MAFGRRTKATCQWHNQTLLGTPVVDLARMPHLQSQEPRVELNRLASDDHLGFCRHTPDLPEIMIDPKMLELSVYDVTSIESVVTDPSRR